MKEKNALRRCYRLSYDTVTRTLFIRIQKWIIEPVKIRLQAETRLMLYLFKTYGGDVSLFENFSLPGKCFGWDNTIQWAGETEDEIIYSYQLTCLLQETNETCERCKGKKIDDFGNPCYTCRETGKKHEHVSPAFNDALISLYPIFRLLNYGLYNQISSEQEPEWMPKTKHLQEVAIEYTDTSGMYKCGLQAWISKEAMGYINNMTNDDAENIIFAMKDADAFILKKKPDLYNFRFESHDKNSLMIEVPGNACSLHTPSSGMGMFPGIDHTLHQHNIDNRFQQLGFIIGLATLNKCIL